MSKDKFLAGIGSYWTQFFQDRDVLEAFGIASTEMLSAVYMELSNLVLSLSHEDMPVYDRHKWDLLVLQSSDAEVVDSKYRFPLPADFNTKGLNRSPVLLSSAVYPKLILYQGYDFNIVDKFIEFNADPFSISGIPVGETGGDLLITLWCPVADIDTNRVWRNYGHFMKRWRFSTPAYKAFVRGMFHARMFGPVVNRVESGLHLIAGLPVAAGRSETVIAVVDNGSPPVVRTNLQDYAIPAYANIRVKSGDTLSPFQAITDAITVSDYISEPAWWRGRIGELPREIGEAADVDAAFEQYLKYNTFLVRVNYLAFLEAMSGDSGSPLFFEKKTVLTYKKIAEPAQFKLDGSYRLGAVTSEQLLGYAGGSSQMAGFLHDFKPSYTYAIILFYLAFEIPVPSWLVYSLRLNKYIDWTYPWDINRLDGSWKLGVGDRPMRLGEFVLDGSRTIPETIPGHTYRQLYNGRIAVSRRLRKSIQTEPNIYVRIGESKLKVGCGGWKLGKNHILCLSDACLYKEIPIDTPPVLETAARSTYTLWYPASPARIPPVGKLSGLKRLDGSWKLGAPLFALRLGDFRVAREKSVLAGSSAILRKKVEMRLGASKMLASHYKLGSHTTRRLDGTWRIGAYHKVDGSWRLRPGKKLAAPRFRRATLSVDGEWRLGTTHDARLDGSWQVANGGMSLDIVIRRINA